MARPWESDLAVARAHLRRQGVRATSQRALVLAILQRSSGHLDASEVYARVRAVGAQVDLSTVYRSLQILVACGLVQEVVVSEPTIQNRYEAIEDAQEPHYHLICQDCGGVLELTNSEFEQQAVQVARQLGFSEERVQVNLIVRCVEKEHGADQCGVGVDGRPNCWSSSYHNHQ
mgnify:CR=1 FL=1